jgi:NADPH-dependent curcumin reductase CurA
MIDAYNGGQPTSLRYIMRVIAARIRIQGFIFTDFMPRMPEFYGEMAPWIASGEVKSRDTIIESLERMPEAFLGLFKGTNTGKMLVKLA